MSLNKVMKILNQPTVYRYMKTASCRFCDVMNELLPGICGMKVKQVGDLFHLKNVPQMPDFYLKHIQIWPWPLFIHAYLSIYEMNNYYH